MNETSREKVDRFVRSLEEALGGSPGQAQGVVAEVRTDLESHIRRGREQGMSDAEAVDRALAEMGDPQQLAQRVRREIPPFAARC
jgi:hypothetical protein